MHLLIFYWKSLHLKITLLDGEKKNSILHRFSISINNKKINKGKYTNVIMKTKNVELPKTKKPYLLGTISTILYRPGQVQYLPNTQHCYQSQPVQKGTKPLQKRFLDVLPLSVLHGFAQHTVLSWMQTSKTDWGPARLHSVQRPRSVRRSL